MHYTLLKCLAQHVHAFAENTKKMFQLVKHLQDTIQTLTKPFTVIMNQGVSKTSTSNP